MTAVFQCFLNLKKKDKKIINKASHHRQLLNRTMGFQTRFLLLLHGIHRAAVDVRVSFPQVYRSGR